jgi:hypothetical protein
VPGALFPKKTASEELELCSQQFLLEAFTDIYVGELSQVACFRLQEKVHRQKRGEAEVEKIRKEEFVCKQAIKEPEKYPEKEANRYSNQIPAPGVQG